MEALEKSFVRANTLETWNDIFYRKKIEIKWAFIFSGMFLSWMIIEDVLGFHSRRLEMQQLVTGCILIPSFLIYILALKNKQRNDYGNITYKKNFVSGVWLTLFIVALSPINQIITSNIISPQYFSNLINYTVSKGLMEREQALHQFNDGTYIIQSVIGGLLTGLLFTSCISLFIRPKNK
jgi:hypothetical protein